MQVWQVYVQQGALHGCWDHYCILVQLWDELCRWAGELEVAHGLSDDFFALIVVLIVVVLVLGYV